MTNRHGAVVLGLSLFLGLVFAPPASAWETQLREPGRVLIGWWGGDPYAVSQSYATGVCSAYRLGYGESDPHYIIYGTDSRDDITFVGSAQWFCNRTIQPIDWYHVWFEIYGMGGGDTLTNESWQTGWLAGGDGDDVLINVDTNGTSGVMGGGGDDFIIGNDHDLLYGNAGNDTFCLQGTAWQVVGSDGDPGETNTYCGSAYEVYDAASSCPCGGF